jgi:hypothetical protein
MRRRAVLTLTVVSSAIAIGAAAGCGGSSDDHDKSVASQATAQALAKERQRQQHAAEQQNIRKLKRKLRRERRKNASNGGASSPGSGRSKDCGSGITANAVTTCPFARNVVKAYRSSGGAADVDAYSPVTNENYHMACSGTSTTTCTGGNDASDIQAIGTFIFKRRLLLHAPLHPKLRRRSRLHRAVRRRRVEPQRRPTRRMLPTRRRDQQSVPLEPSRAPPVSSAHTLAYST